MQCRPAYSRTTSTVGLLVTKIRFATAHSHAAIRLFHPPLRAHQTTGHIVPSCSQAKRTNHKFIVTCSCVRPRTEAIRGLKANLAVTLNHMVRTTVQLCISDRKVHRPGLLLLLLVLRSGKWAFKGV